MRSGAGGRAPGDAHRAEAPAAGTVAGSSAVNVAASG